MTVCQRIESSGGWIPSTTLAQILTTKRKKIRGSSNTAVEAQRMKKSIPARKKRRSIRLSCKNSEAFYFLAVEVAPRDEIEEEM